MEEMNRLKSYLSQNEDFKKAIYACENLEEAIKLVKEAGFNVKKDDILNDSKLNEDILESISGGGKRVRVREVDLSGIAIGDDTTIINNMTIKQRAKP